MKPIQFEEVTMFFTRPDNMTDEKCKSLPVYTEPGVDDIISCWKLSWKERIQILFTGKMWLGVMSLGHPPVWLSTDVPFNRPKKWYTKIRLWRLKENVYLEIRLWKPSIKILRLPF